MPFESLSFAQFRNIQNGSINTAAKQIFLVGNNGQGKTNFLEAIYLLCYGSSFRTKRLEDLILRRQKASAIHGLFVDSIDQQQTAIRVQLGDKKIIEISGKPVIDRQALMDVVPCVVFCHQDIAFVNGSLDDQRQFFNQTAALVFPNYLFALRNYSKALKARNLLLKQQSYNLIGIYDQQLVQYGLQLIRQRRSVVDLLNQEFSPRYAVVSGGLSGLGVDYRPSWQNDSPELLLQQLIDKRSIDFRFAATTSGPHRDKFFFIKDGQAFLPIASTGQVRLISLLLKLCQAILVQTVLGKKPILLLDDVLLELDSKKRQQFIRQLPDHEQVFFTFLPDAEFDAVRHDSSLVYTVEEGTYREKSR